MCRECPGFITSMSRIFGHESLFTFIEKDINVLNKLTSPSQFFCSSESNYSLLFISLKSTGEYILLICSKGKQKMVKHININGVEKS